MNSSKTKRRNGRTNQPNRGPRTVGPPKDVTIPERQTAISNPAGVARSEAGSSRPDRTAPSNDQISHVAAHGGWYRWSLGWFACSLVAWLHLGVVNWLNINLSDSDAGAYVIFAALGAPAVLTAWRVPSARRGAWRWLAVWSLMALTVGGSAMVALLAGEAVLLHRWWVSERRYGYRWAPTAKTLQAAGQGAGQRAVVDQ